MSKFDHIRAKISILMAMLAEMEKIREDISKIYMDLMDGGYDVKSVKCCLNSIPLNFVPPIDNKKEREEYISGVMKYYLSLSDTKPFYQE